jgi:adenylate kinase family enzyme
MANIQFPIFKTKIEGLKRKFDLADVKERERYFEAKAGKEIKKLRNYLKNNTFIVYLMGKKNSGKGTYAKMFKEVVDKDKIEHLSIGDVVRSFDEALKDKKKKKELVSFLEKNYRGYHSMEEIIKALENRSTQTLLPSELILPLVKNEIAKRGKKALFIDGFPRELDQVSYSLFFRDLIDYRQDPDVFALIETPETVIDERIKYRVICPVCQTSRNLKLLPTKEIGYDKKEKKFFLICDNTECKNPQRMVAKEGDEWGVEPIKERLKKDEELMNKAFSLYGIPKILLRNSVPTDEAKEFVDDYEITPEYVYQWDEKNKKVKVIKKPWQVQDKGVPSNSLLPPPVVVALIKQMAEVLGL